MNDAWDGYSRVTRARLRTLAAKVRHAELEANLAKLEENFRAWRADRITAEELQERVHAFHQGPGLEWYKDALDRRPIATLVRGLGSGLLQLNELPDEARPGMARSVSILFPSGSG